MRSVGETVQVSITGQNIQQKVLDQLKREIKGQLIIAGFDIADKVNPKTLNLNVNVIEFDPGNAALRLTVGFGAGRGSLLYLAEYKNQEGKILASINGGGKVYRFRAGFQSKLRCFCDFGRRRNCYDSAYQRGGQTYY